MEKKERKLPRGAFAVTASLLVLEAELLGVLMRLDLLPGRYLLPICLGALAFDCAVGALLWNWRHRVLWWTGLAVGTLAGVLFLAVGFVAARGLNALNTVTMPEAEVTHIGVYVRAEDSAESLEEIQTYPFGILEALNREAVDTSLEEINGRFGTEVAVSVFSTPTELIDALESGGIGAAVMNTAYLDLLEESDAYADIYEKIREITTVEVAAEPTPTSEPEPEVPSGPVEPFLLYISGIDSRKGLNVVSCSDVNILAAVNPEERQILLLSTPRDYCMPLSISDGALDKLSHAGVHGIQCSIDTLEMFYDVDIDYYFRVHFKGFREIIDALGGLVVYSEEEFNARNKPEYHYVKGYNFVDGDKALHFARERFAFAAGDIQRGKNQMQVIQLVLKKLLSPAILTNFTSLLEAVEGNFETTVPYSLIANLVRNQLDDPSGWDVVTYTVTGTDATVSTFTYGTAYVMMPDEQMVETAKGLLHDVLDGKRIEEPES